MGHLVLSPSMSFYYPPSHKQSEEVCAGVVEVSGVFWVFSLFCLPAHTGLLVPSVLEAASFITRSTVHSRLRGVTPSLA